MNDSKPLKKNFTLNSWKIWAVLIMIIAGCIIAAGYEVSVASNLIDVFID